MRTREKLKSGWWRFGAAGLLVAVAGFGYFYSLREWNAQHSRSTLFGKVGLQTRVSASKSPAALPPAVGKSWLAEVQKNIVAAEYEIRWQEQVAAYQSPNRAQNLRFTYGADGFRAEPRVYERGKPWKLDLRLASIS